MDSFKAYSAKKDHDIIVMYQGGKDINEIKTGLNVSTGNIYRVLHDYGIKPHRRNVAHLHELIRNYHFSGTPVSRIAEIAGLSKRQIYNIVKNKLSD